MMESVCVYCASSNRSSPIYLDAAARLGRILAENGITIVYGGSSLGSMGRLAAAAIALPGGCGTLEELFEAIAWKRLGLYFGPVVLVNVNGFFDPCIELLNRCVEERFMDEKHRAMWSVARCFSS